MCWLLFSTIFKSLQNILILLVEAENEILPTALSLCNISPDVLYNLILCQGFLNSTSWDLRYYQRWMFICRPFGPCSTIPISMKSFLLPAADG